MMLAELDVPGADVAAIETIEAQTSDTQTRVAMLPDESTSSNSEPFELEDPPPDVSSTDSDDSPQPVSMGIGTQPEVASPVPVPEPSFVPAIPEVSMAVETTTMDPIPEKELEPVVDPEPERGVSKPLQQNDRRSPAPETAEATVPDESPEMPVVNPQTHFNATAHLAMRNVKDYRLGGTTKVDGEKDPHPTTAAGVKDGRPQRRMTPEETRRMNGDATEVSKLVNGKSKNPFGSTPQALIEEVILQQPMESRPVSRMENVVALTSGRGIPIALVKSDLPDDHWWVQQMVGYRGNAFAARVNFGNENSIRGSVYHLIFVFLDSPDEVRRFRIAKQFKKLPEGVRRSRQYTFVRR